MENRINKPKVFLSHAWENKPFIEKIAADLRRCGIDYWLDSEEIRDGRSWPKMIFEDGLPTCDAVIVYFTEQSIASRVVQKELDAVVVQQLSDQRVNLLPYVSKASIRGLLRSDIQTLHCREWNAQNYDSLLPTVVAEIWRGYLERTIETAVLQEKNRRLEQELENKLLKEKYESSIFSAREEQEFRFLYERLSRKFEVTFGLFKKRADDRNRSMVAEETCLVSIVAVLLATIENGGVYLEFIGQQIFQALGKTLELDGEEVRRGFIGKSVSRKLESSIQTETNTFGLTNVTKKQHFDELVTAYEFSEKMYRFKYWIEYNQLIPNEPLEHQIRVSPEAVQVNHKQAEKDRTTAKALAVDRKLSQIKRRKTWSTNGEGTVAATETVAGIFEDLRNRVAGSNEVLKNIELSFHADQGRCCVSTSAVVLNLNWNCPTNNLDDCVLTVLVNHSKNESESETKTYFLNTFGIKTDNDLKLLWMKKGTSYAEPCSSRHIADLSWDMLMTAVQRYEEES